MSRDEKKAAIEQMAEKFTKMTEEDKAFITGYMMGKEEERQKWQKKSSPAA